MSGPARVIGAGIDRGGSGPRRGWLLGAGWTARVTGAGVDRCGANGSRARRVRVGSGQTLPARAVDRWLGPVAGAGGGGALGYLRGPGARNA